MQKRWSACSWLRVNASTSLFSLFCHMLRSEFFLHQAVTLITPSSLLFVELYQNFIFLNIGAKIFYRSLITDFSNLSFAKRWPFDLTRVVVKLAI